MKKIFIGFCLIFISILTLRSQPCVSNCSLYTVSSVTPAFLFNAGGNAGSNQLNLNDDQVSPSVPLGFSFSFMCATYTNCKVSSNGFLSFNPSVGNGCCAGQTCPTVGGNPNNYVAWAWCDLTPNLNGSIKYQTLGTAPNRIFVLTYSLIPIWLVNGPPYSTGQIQLYETSNRIEIHNGYVRSGGTKTQGIMNLAGTAGFPVVGRNAVNWTTNGDAYRWTPASPVPSPSNLGSIVGNTSVCVGSSNTYSVPLASGATSYSWSLPGGWSGSSNSNSIITTAAASGILSITATYSCGVSPSRTFAIASSTILPSVTIIAGNVACAGSIINLTANGATSYTWGSGAIANTISPAPLVNTTYTVLGRNSCGTATAAINLTVNPIPTISAIASTASLCSGATATLIGSGASSYTWSNGVTNGLSFSPLTTNIYTLTGSSALGCTATAVVGITVVNTPNQMPLPSPPSLCNGNSSTLTAIGATNYTWQPGNFNTASIVVTPTTTSVWTCTMANANCVSTQSVSVIVNQLPNVVTLVTPTIVCTGKSASITAGGALTYTWTQGTYTLIGANIVVTPTANTVFTITASNGTCSAQPTFTMLTLPSPTLIVTSSSSVICFGQTASLTVSGAVTYTWNAPVNLNTASISVSPTAPIAYSVSGTNSVGCISGKTQIVLVNPNPILTTGITPSFVCIGAASTATVTGANTYSWNTGSTSSITAINPTTTTVYTVTGTNSNTGCQTTETVMVVTFQPTLVVTTATSVCIGTSITLNASGAVSYTWNTGVVGSGSNSTISVGPSVYTTYSVTATTSSMVAGYVLNCLASNTIGVTVNQNPIVTATCIRTLICRGETTSLTANGAFTYNWLAPLQTTGSIVAVSPYSTTNYTMIGTDANGCKDTTSIQIKVSACVGVGELNNLSELIKVYPNPNNGEFEITSKGIDIELKIINDLGQLVKIINLNKINNYEIKVNELSNGIYFIVGKNKTTNINQKIIVNK